METMTLQPFKVYVAGPIAGYPLGNISAFRDAKARLEAEGYEVINPHEVPPVEHPGEECPPGPPGGENEEGKALHTAPCYMRNDLIAMLGCDAIYLLTGFQKSTGSTAELAAAKSAGLQIWHEADAAMTCARLERQKKWSERTFGPYPRWQGVVDHIKRELKEIKKEPTDVREWIDVIILGFDGALGTGVPPQQILEMMELKQYQNEMRTWPDWRTADRTKAIEHDRSVPDAL